MKLAACVAMAVAVMAVAGAALSMGQAWAADESPSAQMAASSSKIKEGTYKIASSIGRMVQVAAKKTKSGRAVTLAKRVKTNKQKWFISPVSNVKDGFRIQSVQSGRYLTAEGDAVVERSYKKDDSQIWIASKKSKRYYFTNKALNSLLVRVGNSKLGLASPEASSASAFKLTSVDMVDEGVYYIQPRSSKKALVVSNASMSSGANVKLAGRSSGGSFKWSLISNEDGTYTISNTNSARVLAVKSGRAKRGSNVMQATYDKGKTKRWKLKLNKKGRINIVSAANGKTYLGSGSLKSGANVRMIGSPTAKMAEFEFTKTSKPYDRAKMDKKIQKYSSKTGWAVEVSTDTCTVAVYKGKKGHWVPYTYFKCSVGAPGSSTVKGLFQVGTKGYSFGSGYTCYYFTQFHGNYLFHSVLYNQGTRTIQDGRLGMRISHGCVRLHIDNARWIYNNIPRGSRVYVY